MQTLGLGFVSCENYLLYSVCHYFMPMLFLATGESFNGANLYITFCQHTLSYCDVHVAKNNIGIK